MTVAARTAPPRPASPTKPGIQIIDISKTFESTLALDAVNLSISSGEMVGLIGPSGSGKSTLLRLCNGLVGSDPRPGSEIRIGGVPIQSEGKLRPNARAIRSRIGFIFQRFNLAGRLSLHRNALVGCCAQTPFYRNLLMWHRRQDRVRAMEALRSVGLADRARQRASTLSGGQQQRGAIARAIMQRAEIVLADEPIASLDPQSARAVMEILRELNRNRGITILVTLHQVEVARRFCRRIVAIREGRIQFDGPSEELSEERLGAIYGARRLDAAELREPVSTGNLRFA